MQLRLRQELKLFGLDVEDFAFESVLADVKNASFRSYPRDDLLCRLGESGRFCDLVRKALGCREIPEEMILRRFANMDKNSESAVHRTGRQSRKDLAAELEELGIALDPGDFSNRVAVVFARHTPLKKTEQLLYRRDEASRYCATVRAVLRIPEDTPSDYVTLRTLINQRKRLNQLLAGPGCDALTGPDQRRPRGPEWDAVRSAAFERDSFICQYCGFHDPTGERLEADHVTPLSRGGPSDLGNVKTACVACNQSKHDRTLVEWVRSIAGNIAGTELVTLAGNLMELSRRSA